MCHSLQEAFIETGKQCVIAFVANDNLCCLSDIDLQHRHIATSLHPALTSLITWYAFGCARLYHSQRVATKAQLFHWPHARIQWNKRQKLEDEQHWRWMRWIKHLLQALSSCLNKHSVLCYAWPIKMRHWCKIDERITMTAFDFAFILICSINISVWQMRPVLIADKKETCASSTKPDRSCFTQTHQQHQNILSHLG